MSKYTSRVGGTQSDQYVSETKSFDQHDQYLHPTVSKADGIVIDGEEATRMAAAVGEKKTLRHLRPRHIQLMALAFL